MGIEFTIAKDLSTISATATELSAIDNMLCLEMISPDFQEEYGALLLDIVNTYQGLDRALQPLCTLLDPKLFIDRFEHTVALYKATYQSALSEPRINAEFTYEKYLQFRKRRELKTSYPILARAFERLHEFIDKWIDNDIWLAMTIDSLLKKTNRVLSELESIKVKDPEMAETLYQAAFASMPDYLRIIQTNIAQISDHHEALKPSSQIANSIE